MSVTPEQRARFAQACQWAQPEPPGGIGRLGEKTLHAVLKRYLEKIVLFFYKRREAKK